MTANVNGFALAASAATTLGTTDHLQPCQQAVQVTATLKQIANTFSGGGKLWLRHDRYPALVLISVTM
jgi:hypothetical protein